MTSCGTALRASALLSMPMRLGMTPVIMLKRDGTHTGLAQYARSNRAPAPASASREGVFTHGLPAQLSMPACIWSQMIRRTFVLPDAAPQVGAAKSTTATLVSTERD